MSLVAMRDEVFAKFGQDSFEGGYIQYIFSKRSSLTFIDTYNRLMATDYIRKEVA